MQLRKCGASPSATKDITTSSSQEGRKVRSDSVQQPYIQQHAHGTGAVIAGIAGLTIDCSSSRNAYNTEIHTLFYARRKDGL